MLLYCHCCAARQAYLLKLDPERFTPPNFIGFSAQTSANMTQVVYLIISKFEVSGRHWRQNPFAPLVLLLSHSLTG
jgi:hypothetical protein